MTVHIKEAPARLRLLPILLVFCFQSARTQTNRVLFIFDDSYSMYAPWASHVKIEVAKKVMAEFMDSLRRVPNLELALRCYGHTTFFKERNCKDTKLEVPFDKAAVNAPKIKERIRRLEPLGTTPIAYSLGESVNDFPPCGNCRNIVILITDGLEECGGFPCEVSADLQKKKIFLRPFVIGIGLDPKYHSAFACMGKYYDVSNEANFREVLKQVITEALTQTTVQVDLLDSQGKPTETDVDMTFYEAGTGRVRYNYLHTINHRGNPDTLVLNPDLRYDLEVHTIPPVSKKEIRIEKGKHNVIPLDAPQGALRMEIDGTINPHYPTTLVRRHGEMATLHVHEFGKTEKYIVGRYDVEILTLPRIYAEAIEIKQSSTNTIRIPASGTVIFSKQQNGSGSVYTDDGKTVTWVCNLNPTNNGEIIYLQPGKYKAVFRTAESRETLRTIERNFEVKSGTQQTVRLF